MKKTLIAAIAISLNFAPYTIADSYAAVISGKSTSGTTSKSTTSGATAKAIAAQQAVVDDLLERVKNGNAVCPTLKGKDTAKMLACMATLKEFKKSLLSEQAKLAALKKAAGGIKNVSTSTVDANPIVVDVSVSADDFKKALARIASLESEIANLKALLRAKGFAVK